MFTSTLFVPMLAVATRTTQAATRCGLDLAQNAGGWKHRTVSQDTQRTRRAWIGPPWTGECNVDAGDVANASRFLPESCPTLGLEDAARCIQARKFHGVIYLGDSLSFQEAGSLSCDAIGAFDTSWSGNRSRGYFLEHIENLPIPIIMFHALVKGKAMNTADAMASAVKNAVEDGHFGNQKPFLWMVNAGIWHLVCSKHDGCMDPHYPDKVDRLLTVLEQNVQGGIVWKDTTASHKKNMDPSVGKDVLEKFAGFTEEHEEILNRQARLVVSQHEEVHLLEHHFDATKNRADDLIPGDIRHYRGDVLYTLGQISMLSWCSLL